MDATEIERLAAMPDAGTDCWMCQPVTRVQKVLLWSIPLCASHRDEHVAVLREYAALHPDGCCTEACGCMSGADLKAALRRPEGGEGSA